MTKEAKKIFAAAFTLIIVFIIGTTGYVYIEGFSILNGIYMTLITISTVGFGEVEPLSEAGRILTSGLILSGISIVIYAVSVLTNFLIEGDLRAYLRRKKMDKKIKKLERHYIIAGGGRTGKRLVEEFMQSGKPFVLIDKEEDSIQCLITKYREKLLYIVGDATVDATLKKADIETAKALISVLPGDADNLFLTLSAKTLNKEIKVVTRAVDPNTEAKLIRAGADRIVSPLEIAANRMFVTATESNVVSFLDVLGQDQQLEGLNFASVEIKEGSGLNMQNLIEAKIPQRTNLIVIGIEKEGKLEINPRSHTVLNIGDKLMVLGDTDQIEVLKGIAG